MRNRTKFKVIQGGVPTATTKPLVQFRLIGDAEPQVMSWREAAQSVPFWMAEPIRSFNQYKGMKNVLNTWWSAKDDRHLACESLNERNWVAFFEHDPATLRMSTQPFKLLYADADGKVRRHTVDIVVYRQDLPPLAVDAKADRFLAEAEESFTTRMTAALCEAVGWEYQLVGDLDRATQANVMRLAGFRKPPHNLPWHGPALINACAQPTPLADLIAAVDGVPRDIQGVLLHLLWWQHLTCDLTTPLSGRTVVSRGVMPL